MKRIAYVGDVAFEWDDSVDYDDPRVRHRLYILLKVVLSISRCKRMINTSNGCPHLETKPSEVLSGEEPLMQRPSKRHRKNPCRKR
jgi:hypothetical protein